MMEKYSIGYIFYIGGNDSMDTVAKLDAFSRKNRLDVSVIGIPKTIDNDLILTDHTPGYGSCAKYVATTVYEIARDISVYTQPRVTVVEVMGRDSGWLGCAAAMSKLCFGIGCDLLYLPEMAFSIDGFLSHVEDCLRIKNNVLVCTCEGVLAESFGKGADPFGHMQHGGIGKLLEGEVGKKIGCRTRSVELNLPQRCAGHLLSKTDIEESVCIGKSAVEAALLGKSGKMLSFERRSGRYGVDINCVDAAQVANKIKHVPGDFANKEQNFVTDRCLEYVSPLIMGEVDVKYVMGMPHHFDIEGYLCTK